MTNARKSIAKETNMVFLFSFLSCFSSLSADRKTGETSHSDYRSFELKLQCWFPDMNILELNFALML